MKIKITLSYDGTNYHGWQKQKDKITVQEEIENALYKITGEKIKTVGSGRTDAGVHAKNQVAHFTVNNKNIPPKNYAKALNTALPQDIKVLKSERVNDGFDASRSAKKKTYEYNFYLSDTVLPLLDRYSEKISPKTDVEKIKEIVNVFVGEHDFKGYCASNGSAKTTVRNIYDVKVIKKGINLRLEITGNGFLYNMVRNVFGACLCYADGKITKEEIIKSLTDGIKPQKTKTLAAKGLTLKKVVYKK